MDTVFINFCGMKSEIESNKVSNNFNVLFNKRTLIKFEFVDNKLIATNGVTSYDENIKDLIYGKEPQLIYKS